VRIEAEVNVFLRELKASWQEELKFYRTFIWVRHVNEMTMSK